MPATGVRPPDLMLAAVRAIAPVAGRPPNRPDARLAMPWPTSSWLERWRKPVPARGGLGLREPHAVRRQVAVLRLSNVAWQLT